MYLNENVNKMSFRSELSSYTERVDSCLKLLVSQKVSVLEKIFIIFSVYLNQTQQSQSIDIMPHYACSQVRYVIDLQTCCKKIVVHEKR